MTFEELEEQVANLTARVGTVSTNIVEMMRDRDTTNTILWEICDSTTPVRKTRMLLFKVLQLYKVKLFRVIFRNSMLPM